VLGSSHLAAALFSRIEEEATLTLRLMERVPMDASEWRPDWPSAGRPPFTVRVLCAHLCDSLSGTCAVLVKLTGESSPAAAALRARVEKASHGSIAESMTLLSDLLEFLQEHFPRIPDSNLTRVLPHVFVAAGKPAMTMLLTNLVHFTNHKYQLFTYLKVLGVPVSTQDLYRFDT